LTAVDQALVELDQLGERRREVAAVRHRRESGEATEVVPSAAPVVKLSTPVFTPRAKGGPSPTRTSYSDDGVSGTLFGAARPGLAWLLNALSPRPPLYADSSVSASDP
jgi:hypothetical protein